MLELTERLSLRISFVLSKLEMEPEPGAGPLHRLRLWPKSIGSNRLRLRNTGQNEAAPDRIQQNEAAPDWIRQNNADHHRIQ